MSSGLSRSMLRDIDNQDGTCPSLMREISLDHSSDWINKCMAVLGLSVNPRVEPNIMWQGNNMYIGCGGSSDMIFAYA